MVSYIFTGQHVNLVEGPTTLLLPVNKNGTFFCKAQCNHQCAAYWLINGSELYMHNNMQQMHRQLYGNTSVGYTLTLTVNATNTLNNTRVRCRYEASGERHGFVYSTEAFLLVISSMNTKTTLCYIVSQLILLLCRATNIAKSFH